MKYKYISTKGSVLQIRLTICLPVICSLLLIISYFWEDEKYIVKIFLGLIGLLNTYFLSRFSTVKYNSSEIVIQNIMGEIHYPKDELLTVKPLRPYLNLYSIVFNDNKSYPFGLPSSRIMLALKGKQVAENMKMKLLSNETDK